MIQGMEDLMTNLIDGCYDFRFRFRVWGLGVRSMGVPPWYAHY